MSVQRYFRGAGVRFDARGAGSAEPLAPRVGVWDQALVEGSYEKPALNGKPLASTFDRETCAQMLEDFRGRKNDLFLDKMHEVTEEIPAPPSDDDLQSWGDQHALAWYSAMAQVADGKVARYAAHAGAPAEPPTIEDLRRPDGSAPADGLYVLRSQITPRGADPKDGILAFRYVSPYYFQKPDGGGKDRYRLLNITATNDSFLDGVALAMSARAWERAPLGPQGKETRMEEMYARAGCMENDTPEQKLEKLARYAQRMEEEAKKAKETPAAGASAASETPPPPPAAGAPAQAMGDLLIEHKEDKDKDKDAPAAMAAMARRAASEATAQVLKALGYPADLDGAAEKRKLELSLLQKMERATADAEKTREAAAKTEAEEWAKTAVAMGRWDGAARGDYHKTVDWLKEKRLKDAAAAEEMLFPEGKFQPSEEAVLQRMTRGGAGIGAPDPREGGATPSQTWDMLIGQIQAESKKNGKTLRFVEAEQIAKTRHPGAFQAYARSKVGG